MRHHIPAEWRRTAGLSEAVATAHAPNSYGPAAAVFLLQLLHGCSGEILFHEIPTLAVGQSIRTEEKGEQLNLLLEDTFVRVQYKIMIFVGIRQLLQKFRVIEPYMHAGRTASLDAERQAVEHGKKVEQHIQIGERSAIELQAVAPVACDTLGEQLLITGQKQVETFGDGKRKLVRVFLLDAADIT